MITSYSLLNNSEKDVFITSITHVQPVNDAKDQVARKDAALNRPQVSLVVGGRTVMFLMLLFFIIGTTIGAYHLPFWTKEMPAFEPISLATSTGLGYGGAWLVSIMIFGLVALASVVIEKKEARRKLRLFHLHLDGNGFPAAPGLYLPLPLSWLF
ncbi:hypothetical protein [Planococcus sp. ISL-110]|uniref:hypothetical protein n=1 Tax=Planococcus sp. ISL-110 TaxID=2819167 RepID=UPI00333AA41E